MILGLIALILAGTGLLAVYPDMMTERVSLHRKVALDDLERDRN